VASFVNYLSRFVSEDSINEVARENGFLKRRSIITPKAFLESLFFRSQGCSPTLTEFAIDLHKHASKAVSKQAVDKRFNTNTKAMLLKLLSIAIKGQLKPKIPLCPDIQQNGSKTSKHFTQIRIMDSTEFLVSKKVAEVFPGYGGKGREAIVQVQYEYDILNQNITQLTLGSALDSDALEGMKEIDSVPKGSLLIRDLGYYSPKAFKELAKRELFFISRAKPQWSLFSKGENGKLFKITPLQIMEKLKELQKQNVKYLDIEVIAGDQARTPVRLIASLLTEEQTNRRIERKRKRDGTKLDPEKQELACLNLFVTNVSKEDYNAQSIYEFYCLRWQIELIFKTLKSVMKIHYSHSMNATRLSCLILIQLIWVVVNWQILTAVQMSTGLEISFHKLCQTLCGRGMKLTIEILKNREKLKEWLLKLIGISVRFHKKEYKKGTENLLIKLVSID